ncbi:hypothetical protein [Noviherbaspirillum sedimenti]|uniref:DUF2486 family protein n=1 Tax=Noviherbaspirillum sedimenti TaxID=2320865 RepID=A0A3A3G6N1_9BURK|nr:hypothetical protein [Noviherbaspirillum sedimenti]RJG04078.1 hypothetical protein D3878_22870 [Noviherbaspirillum sedimenti]
MNNPPADQGIPLLTEVIGPQARSEDGSPAVTANATQAKPAAPFTPPAVARLPDVPAAAPAPVSANDACEPAPAPAPAPAAPDASPLALAPEEAQPVARTEAAPQASPPANAPTEQAASAWSDAELGELESELRQRITRQVLGRIDFVLDHRVRNALTDVVDSAIDALAAEIKRGLHETLTDMVTRAVAQEVSRLQSTKK